MLVLEYCRCHVLASQYLKVISIGGVQRWTIGSSDLFHAERWPSSRSVVLLIVLEVGSIDDLYLLIIVEVINHVGERIQPRQYYT